MEKRFNIRVYGILLNQNSEVLVSDENRFGKQFTKFPGGGLEFGEGTLACLKREFLEELNLVVEPKDLFYCTDFFQQSAFNENDQLISIYYLVETEDCNSISIKNKKFDFNGEQEVHRWISIDTISSEDFDFPIDKIVGEKLNGLKR